PGVDPCTRRFLALRLSETVDHRPPMGGLSRAICDPCPAARLPGIRGPLAGTLLAAHACGFLQLFRIQTSGARCILVAAEARVRRSAVARGAYSTFMRGGIWQRRLQSRLCSPPPRALFARAPRLWLRAPRASRDTHRCDAP